MAGSVSGILLGAWGVLAAGMCWQLTWWDADDRARLVRHLRRIFALLYQVGAALRSRLAPAGVRQREWASLSDVSEMIDVVRLGLSAGLSFDAALELYCSQRATVLAQCLGRAELSWRCGVETREMALAGVAHDTGVRALESFAIAVGQALSLGAPLTDVLASQAREIRAAHRAEVERAIERAPVKLLIPTGTLILPALLLSILGPLLAASGML